MLGRPVQRALGGEADSRNMDHVSYYREVYHMGDLIWGLLILASLAALLFWGAVRLARRGSAWTSTALAMAVAAFLVVFGLTVHGKLVVAHWLPLSNAIILGNGFPLGAAVLAGVAAGRRSIPVWRRTVLGAGLLAGAWWSVLVNLLPGSLPSADRWTPDGVCLQSSEASCSPAAAATLLRHHGIEASEAEMMRLCLTRRGGSPSLGLYRGLKLKTRGTPWRVEVVRGTPDELRRDLATPVLLRMRLRREPTTAARLLGWTGLVAEPGHAVVLYEATADGRLLVGDPASGKGTWPAADFLPHWRGEGLRLVERSP